MRIRLYITALVGLFVALPARADDKASPALKPIAVPFILMPTGHFLVDVKLNDKGPYKLIFDTGAPTMLLNNRISNDVGLKPVGGLGFPFGNRGIATIKSLEVGGAKAEGVNAAVMDHPTVKAFSDFFKKEHGNIDGIVGFPFFARFKMTVDYQKKELTFVPNGYAPEDVMASMMKMMMAASSSKGQPRMVAAAGQWGLVVDKESSDEAAGVKVTSVMKGSAAEKGGLKAGDRMLTLDGRWTDSVADTHHAASYVKPGSPAEVVVQRDGKQLTLTIVPGKGL